MQYVNRKKIMHCDVATYGLPGSAMHADRWPNGCIVFQIFLVFRLLHSDKNRVPFN